MRGNGVHVFLDHSGYQIRDVALFRWPCGSGFLFGRMAPLAAGGVLVCALDQLPVLSRRRLIHIGAEIGHRVAQVVRFALGTPEVFDVIGSTHDKGSNG